MSSARHRILLAMFALLWLPACAAATPTPRTMPYAELAQRLGFGSEQPSSPLADGQTITLELRDERTGQPLEGARLFLGAKELPGTRGRFEVPLRRELLAENPGLRMVPPRGHHGKIRFEIRLTLAGTCEQDRQTAARRERVDLASWRHLTVGPDRIYVEPVLGDVDTLHLQRLLTHGRALLVEVSGVSPPPLAVGLMSDTAPDRYAVPDTEGRETWLVRMSRSHEDSYNGFLVHEWTHALLDALGFPRDVELRYVEDGLADLLGHMAEQRVLARAVGPTLENRRSEVVALARTETQPFDLYALARAYGQAESAAEMIEALCQPGVTRGYALGMAYWLGRTQGRVEALQKQFAAWRSAMPRDAAMVEAQLSHTGASPRKVSATQAQAWLSAP